MATGLPGKKEQFWPQSMKFKLKFRECQPNDKCYCRSSEVCFCADRKSSHCNISILYLWRMSKYVGQFFLTASSLSMIPPPTHLSLNIWQCSLQILQRLVPKTFTVLHLKNCENKYVWPWINVPYIFFHTEQNLPFLLGRSFCHLSRNTLPPLPPLG